MKKIIIGCFIIIIIICILLAFSKIKNHNVGSIKSNNIDIKYSNNKKYYIIKSDYKGEYDNQRISLSEYYDNYEEANDIIKSFNTQKVFDYDQYSDFCKKWNLDKKYDDSNEKYMVISYASYGSPIVKARIADVMEKDGSVTVYMWDNVEGDTADISGYFITIPVSLDVNKYDIILTYTSSEYDKIINSGSNNSNNSGNGVSIDPGVQLKKPIIYIYPNEEMNINIKLSNHSLLTTSYPKYSGEWNVYAYPNGKLKDTKSDKEYYGLYYESIKDNISMKDDGFIVRGEDTVSFLEEKLDILGLNERESNEFIIYWLPILEKNKYNYIRFETKEEINNYMKLLITPTPESVIRVIMDYKPLSKKVKINEQKLISQKRFGYSVVEWGGNEIK